MRRHIKWSKEKVDVQIRNVEDLVEIVEQIHEVIVGPSFDAQDWSWVWCLEAELRRLERNYQSTKQINHWRAEFLLQVHQRWLIVERPLNLLSLAVRMYGWRQRPGVFVPEFEQIGLWSASLLGAVSTGLEGRQIDVESIAQEMRPFLLQSE